MARHGEQSPHWNQLDFPAPDHLRPDRGRLLRETEEFLPSNLPDTARQHLPELMLVYNAADEVPVAPPARPPFGENARHVQEAFVEVFRIEHNNRSGSMTNSEINRLMLRSDLTDDQAISLAVMRSNFDAIRALDPGQAGITNNALARLRDLTERHVSGLGAPLTQTETDLIAGLQSSASTYRGYLERSNRSLYATRNPRDSVVPDACEQGTGIGNCHFVSAMTSLAQTDPQAIVRMITDNNNGTYTVRFPGQTPITVNRPTNAELAYYGTGSSHGLWATVLQNAYGRLWSPNDTANPAIEGAGTSIRSDGLRTLTGESLSTTHTGRLTYWSTLHTNLALANQRPTTATVFSEVGELFGRDPSTGFTGGHEYSILSFVPNAQNNREARVTVQNPHRSMTWPNGQVPAGLIDHGRGVVEMSLEQFNSIFYNFSTPSPSNVRPRQIPRLGRDDR